MWLSVFPFLPLVEVRVEVRVSYWVLKKETAQQHEAESARGQTQRHTEEIPTN